MSDTKSDKKLPGENTGQPGPVQLPTSIEMQMSDNALVTFGAPVAPGALSFHEIGYMPVNALTLAGNIAGKPLPGGLDGMFIHYVSDGVQHFAVSGAPSTADYTG